MFFFFFSSRRRHTRLQGDWSSDVCSSDLVGVIGAGLIAQVMHLHYLRELSDRFETSIICDLVPENAAASAERFGIPRTCTDWRDLLDEPIDAVLVLTGGSHAPMAVEAARSGK